MLACTSELSTGIHLPMQQKLPCFTHPVPAALALPTHARLIAVHPPTSNPWILAHDTTPQPRPK